MTSSRTGLLTGFFTDRGVQIFMAVVAVHACALAALPNTRHPARDADPVIITMLQTPAPSARPTVMPSSAQASPRPAPQAVERPASTAATESPAFRPESIRSASSDSLLSAASTSPALDGSSAPGTTRVLTTVATSAAPPVAVVTPPRFDAAYLDNPAPAYPAASRRLGEQGRVVLRVHVSADGLPRDIETAASSGSQRLDSAARAAVERWRFVPARQGEQAVAAWVLIPLTFTMTSTMSSTTSSKTGNS